MAPAREWMVLPIGHFSDATALPKGSVLGCALGRFIKSKFWKFDISTHFLCDKYHDKEKVQKKFCSNIAPSIGTGPP